MTRVRTHTGKFENLARRVREEREKKYSKERARNPQERHSRQGQREKSSTGPGTAGWGLNSTDRTRSRAEDTCYMPLSPWRAGGGVEWLAASEDSAGRPAEQAWCSLGDRTGSGQVSQCSWSSDLEQTKTDAGAGVAQAGH